VDSAVPISALGLNVASKLPYQRWVAQLG